MLRKIRITLALIFWVLITWLLLDFTGTARVYLGWMAKIQFLPALVAMNIGALLFIAALTLLFGRIYCSVICPLGVMQDVIAWFRKKKNKYSYSEEKGILRAVILTLTGFLLATNLAWVVGLIAPYSTYGRIVGTVFSPLYKLANNGLAMIAEHYDSYAFYQVDVWLKSLPAPYCRPGSVDYHRHSGLEGRQNLVQHHLPRGNLPGHTVQTLTPEDGDKCRGLQELPQVRAKLQVGLHRPQKPYH